MPLKDIYFIIKRRILEKRNIIFIIITIILSYFTLVLGELVPKRIAMRNPDKLARAVCGFIAAMSTILKPIVWLLSKSTNLVLRIFRINPNEIGEDVTEDDIRVMIDAAEEKGDIGFQGNAGKRI